MTVNLGENQVGFDTHKLGFPSIDGCMAIVVVCLNGMYGFHSYGGELSKHWDVRGPAFRDFITGHGGDPTKATRLYGVTHVQSKRGWAGGVRKEKWLEELQAYASKLGTNCRISGYDLDDAIKAKFHKKSVSAYVEFRRVGVKCNVYVESWDTVASTRLAPANNPWGNNIKSIRQNQIKTMTTTTLSAALVAVQGDIFNPITPTGALKQISKSKLQS